MSDDRYTVRVPKDLEDLVPTFLRNRNKEVDTLKSSLEARDFEGVRQIGHRMRGSGRSYGFGFVSELGGRIEDAARNSDAEAVDTCLVEYIDYLEKVKITYE